MANHRGSGLIGIRFTEEARLAEVFATLIAVCLAVSYKGVSGRFGDALQQPPARTATRGSIKGERMRVSITNGVWTNVIKAA